MESSPASVEFFSAAAPSAAPAEMAYSVEWTAEWLTDGPTAPSTKYASPAAPFQRRLSVRRAVSTDAAMDL